MLEISRKKYENSCYRQSTRQYKNERMNNSNNWKTINIQIHFAVSLGFIPLIKIEVF